MAEKLCLQWNDFQENLKHAFGNLREDNDFADVTLACEDGQQVEAHKVILAASSPFFQKLLGRTKHAHPIIFMRGINSDDLLAIVDFLYRGETNINQENLESFLAIAEELQMKGLMGEATQNVANANSNQKYVPQKSMQDFDRSTDIPKQMHDDGQTLSSKFSEDSSNRTVAVSSYFSGNLEELEERVISMMEKSENELGKNYGHRRAHVCKVCGKEGFGPTIKDHIEANHLEGVVIPCNLCNKSFRSKDALKTHNIRKHKIG